MFGIILIIFATLAAVILVAMAGQLTAGETVTIETDYKVPELRPPDCSSSPELIQGCGLS